MSCFFNRTNRSVGAGEGKGAAVVCSLLVIIVLFVFLPSLRCGFVNFDDPLYLTENPLVQHLSLRSVGDIFTTFHYGAYKPFVFLTFLFERHFFGLNPAATHAVNVLFHILNVVLVFRIFFLIEHRLDIALIAAAFFALHPQRVESVVWISERKDMLYAFFFLLALFFYLRFLAGFPRKYYALSLLCFAASLLSKPQGIMFPVALLCLDHLKGRRRDREAWRDKIPFALIVFLILGLNAWAHLSAPAKQLLQANPFPGNLLMAASALVFYLSKLLVPTRLSVLYPFPHHLSAGNYFLAVLFFAIAAFFFLVAKEERRRIVFGVSFFLLMFFPVLPIFVVSSVTVADRYTYLPSIGIFYLLGVLFSRMGAANVRRKVFLVFLLGGMLGGMSFLCRERIKVWVDSISLWDDVLAKYPRLFAPYVFRGRAYADAGEFEKALADYQSALAMDARSGDVYVLRGNLYFARGDAGAAIGEYHKATEANPQYALAYRNRGMVYFSQHRLQEALCDYDAAIRLEPRRAATYLMRGLVFAGLRDFRRAADDFSKAAELQERFVEAYLNRAVAYFYLREFDKSWDDVGRVQALGGSVDQAFLDDLKNRSLL